MSHLPKGLQFLHGEGSQGGGFSGIDGQIQDALAHHSSTFVRVGDSSQNAPAKPAGVPSATRTHRIRRRNRMITSCLECRRRKLKCDKLHPCTNCNKSIRDCVFLAPALDSASQTKMNEIKDKMGVLERGLEQEVVHATKQRQIKPRERASVSSRGGETSLGRRERNASVDLPGQISDDASGENAGTDDQEEDLEPTPLASVDVAYDDDADDELLDLGVKMGKMRMTERIGGYFRPKMAEELEFLLNYARSETVFPGGNRDPIPPIAPLNSESAFGEDRNWIIKESTFLEAGPTYIAPGSSLYFDGPSSEASFASFLPARVTADRLVKQYYEAVHPLAKVVHWPSFLVQSSAFWTTVSAGIEPPASLQTLVFSVMFSAVVSLDEFEVHKLYSAPRKKLLACFQTATEYALGKTNFLRTTKFEALQALVIYLIPMCRNEISRSHSVLVATAIRLAQCMGLHRDPEETYGLGRLESHVRRTLWYQLCFLDIRTAEAQGPRPILRRDDFDTVFPLDINDADLASGKNEDPNVWTDMTFSRMRFECTEMHRIIWVDRGRLEKKKISITHVLAKIESFRKGMESKYHPVMDEAIPLQKTAKAVMDLLVRRMHIMVLHRYHNAVRTTIPDRLRQIILTSGTQQMEDAVLLDTDPDMRLWSWYAGAYQQWHCVFLLLREVYAFPQRKEADRIWRIIDYVFETDMTKTRDQKARTVITKLRDRAGAYRELRKIKIPLVMISRINAGQVPKSSETTVPNPPSVVDFIVPDPTSASTDPPRSELMDTARDDRKASVNSSSPASALSDSSYPQAHTPTSHAYVPSTQVAEKAAAAAQIGPMTRAFADAPSPPATGDTYPEPDWTFDAPNTFFMPKDHTNKPKRRNSLPGEQKDGPTRSPSNDTNSPEGFTLPNFNASVVQRGPGPGQTVDSAMWPNQAEVPGFIFTDVSKIQQRLGPRSPGKDISSSSNMLGPGVGTAGNNPSSSGMRAPQAVAMGMQPDVTMVDIDWSEWDKIFPPETNTGILNTPQATPEF